MYSDTLADRITRSIPGVILMLPFRPLRPLQAKPYLSTSCIILYAPLVAYGGLNRLTLSSLPCVRIQFSGQCAAAKSLTHRMNEAPPVDSSRAASAAVQQKLVPGARTSVPQWREMSRYEMVPSPVYHRGIRERRLREDRTISFSCDNPKSG